MRKGPRNSGNTACLDVDWVVGGCMNVDMANYGGPIRVDCNDRSAPHRQRATQILKAPEEPSRCRSVCERIGPNVLEAYGERRFAVCVEDVT
jgi:hypothetical protein